MKREKRSDKIYKVISRHTQDLELSHLDAGLVFLQIQHLAQETGITPNNVSLEAKLLYEGGRLIRIGNRPVAYASLDHIEKLLGHTVETRVFPSPDSFIRYCLPGQESDAPRPRLHLAESFSASSFRRSWMARGSRPSFHCRSLYLSIRPSSIQLMSHAAFSCPLSRFSQTGPP